MNGLRHIVSLLGIGILFAQDCPEGTAFAESYPGDQENICVPTLFSELSQSTNQAGYIFVDVTIGGTEIDTNDWVGAFNGEVCVGAQKWDTSGSCSDDQYTNKNDCEAAGETWIGNSCLQGVCAVTIMGVDGFNLENTSDYMNNGDIPTFKIYDASENQSFDAVASDDMPWYTLTSWVINNLED